jgi:hypothetical protein
MVQTAKQSVLVAGAIPAESTMDEMTIRALRGFLYRREPVPAGAVLTVPAALGRELIGMAKAARVEAPAATEDRGETRRRGRPPKPVGEPT